MLIEQTTIQYYVIDGYLDTSNSCFFSLKEMSEDNVLFTGRTTNLQLNDNSDVFGPISFILYGITAADWKITIMPNMGSKEALDALSTDIINTLNTFLIGDKLQEKIKYYNKLVTRGLYTQEEVDAIIAAMIAAGRPSQAFTVGLQCNVLEGDDKKPVTYVVESVNATTGEPTWVKRTYEGGGTIEFDPWTKYE